jgi:hypothetical protein
MANLSTDFGMCPDCHRRREASSWCINCDVKRLEENFNLWTSGDPAIDDFIRNTQRNATRCMDYLEWIDHSKFSYINNTGKAGAFTSNYTATWTEGPYVRNDNGTWSRGGPIKVVLKQFTNFIGMNNMFLGQVNV